MCAPGSSGTRLVCHWNREHTTDPLHPLPAHADAARGIQTMWGSVLTDPFCGDARHAVPAGPPHTTPRNHARCDGAVPPARHAGARLPIPRAGSSSEDQVECKGGQAETKASDRQGQMRTDHLAVMKWLRFPGRSGDCLCHRIAFQEDACQVRPMVRCPSVPSIYSIIY